MKLQELTQQQIENILSPDGICHCLKENRLIVYDYNGKQQKINKCKNCNGIVLIGASSQQKADISSQLRQTRLKNGAKKPTMSLRRAFHAQAEDNNLFSDVHVHSHPQPEVNHSPETVHHDMPRQKRGFLPRKSKTGLHSPEFCPSFNNPNHKLKGGRNKNGKKTKDRVKTSA